MRVTNKITTRGFNVDNLEEWVRDHGRYVKTVTVYETIIGADVTLETEQFYCIETYASYPVACRLFGPQEEGVDVCQALLGVPVQHMRLDGEVEYNGEIGGPPNE